MVKWEIWKIETLQDGALSRAVAFRNALFQWLKSMVYGRYNELVFMGIMMVYKSTYKPLEMVKMAH